MTVPTYSSFVQACREGRRASYVRAMKSAGGSLSLVESALPAGVTSDPAVPDLVLHQTLVSGCRVGGDLGVGRFAGTTERGGLFLTAPDFAATLEGNGDRRTRSLSFPKAQWKSVLGRADGDELSFDYGPLHKGMFRSPAIRSAMQHLWRLCDEEGAPSRLLAQAAGCEILAELSQLAGSPLEGTTNGLAPWAERRCLELMRAHLSEDISLDELAAEARLSPFHFARMFKQSVGVPPRVYLTRLRMEKACELLEMTDLPITHIAQEVGYSSNQVLARVFVKHRYMSPTDYRRAVRDPVRRTSMQGLEARQ
jgi:AraC family transcriptional regulator